MPAPTLSEDWRSHLAALQPGWDGDDAPPISEAALYTLGAFSVVPCNNGGLNAEIHQNGIDIEIEIGPDGGIESVLVSPTRKVVP